MKLARPRSRGSAACAIARNDAVPVHPSAVAAYKHLTGASQVQFRWNIRPMDVPRGIRHLEDGPRTLLQMWRKLFVHEVVAKSKLFAALTPELLQLIAS